MEDIVVTAFHPRHFIEESGPYPKYSHPKICVICEERIASESIHCYCPECDLRFHKECPIILMESSSNLTIHHPETHDHTLTLIRKKNSFKCDVCGNVDEDKMNTYACLPCSFVVHRKCIYLPKVIKLTRHSHRLILTFQFPYRINNCQFCFYPVARGHGGYICIDNTCDYNLHSYCATHRDIWDGKDVEKEPEETSNLGDVSISSTLEQEIRHFSHHHDLLRLYVNNEEEEEDGRVCQACILPIEFDSFLVCKDQCDFALHDTCASLPRKLEHTSHRHSLILQVNTMNTKEGFFCCSKCERESCGFMYKCTKEECGITMDVKCASLTDPFYTTAHKHSLALRGNILKCLQKCFFVMSFKRATLPVLVKYKYDTHPLTLLFSHYPSYYRPFWCDICEVKIKPDYPDYEDMYVCTECKTSLHVECMIGKHPYMKRGHTIKVNGFEIEIISNSLSRPTCHICQCICQDKLVFKNRRDHAVSFCSIKCIT